MDGKIVVEGGQVPGICEADLIQKAAEAHLWQKERFADHHPGGESAGVLFPNTYPELGGQ